MLDTMFFKSLNERVPSLPKSPGLSQVATLKIEGFTAIFSVLPTL